MSVCNFLAFSILKFEGGNLVLTMPDSGRYLAFTILDTFGSYLIRILIFQENIGNIART